MFIRSEQRGGNNPAAQISCFSLYHQGSFCGCCWRCYLLLRLVLSLCCDRTSPPVSLCKGWGHYVTGGRHSSSINIKKPPEDRLLKRHAPWYSLIMDAARAKSAKMLKKKIKGGERRGEGRDLKRHTSFKANQVGREVLGLKVVHRKLSDGIFKRRWIHICISI